MDDHPGRRRCRRTGPCRLRPAWDGVSKHAGPVRDRRGHWGRVFSHAGCDDRRADSGADAGTDSDRYSRAGSHLDANSSADSHTDA